jgi:hypothetical protein
VPRHVAWLVARLVVDYFASRRLVIVYFASCRLVVDYFAYAARPGASARRAARLLLRLHLASRCLGTSHGSSRGSSSTTSPTSRVRVPRHVAQLIVDYFASRRLVVNYYAYIAHPGASARRTACR